MTVSSPYLRLESDCTPGIIPQMRPALCRDVKTARWAVSKRNRRSTATSLLDVHEAVAVLFLHGFEVEGGGELLLDLLAEAGAGLRSAGLALQSCGFSTSFGTVWKCRNSRKRELRYKQ